MSEKYLSRDIIFLEHFQNHETQRGCYLKGLALDCFQNPDKDRQSHYFARECMYTGRWKTAIKEFERHIAMNRWPAEAAQSMLYIGNCYLYLGDNNQAEYWYHRAMLHDPSRREAFFACGEMYHKNKDYQKSSIYFAAALQIPWHGGFYGSRMELYKQMIHLLQSVNYFYLNRKKESLDELLKAYEQSPHDELILNNFKYLIEFPPVSIVIPNYKRNVDKLVESFKNDNYFGEVEIVVEVDKDGVGCPITLNNGVIRASNDFVVFLGDDCEIEDKNWLNHAMIKYQTSFSDGVGLVALNDGMYFDDWKPKLACHWLSNKKILPLLIDCKFFNEEVKHYGCDDILTIQCQKFNKLAYAENSKIKHPRIEDETKEKAKKSWKKDQEITNSILNLFR